MVNNEEYEDEVLSEEDQKELDKIRSITRKFEDEFIKMMNDLIEDCKIISKYN